MIKLFYDIGYGGKIMGFNFKKLFSSHDDILDTTSEDEYYTVSKEEAMIEGGEGSKLFYLNQKLILNHNK